MLFPGLHTVQVTKPGETSLAYDNTLTLFLSFSLDRFCNGKLSCMAKSTENHGVLSSVLPFEIFVVFTKTGDTATIDRGFALEYTQNSC